MVKTYSSSSSLVITSRWFATSRLRAPVSVRPVYWVSIGSDNGLSPVRLQAITWTNAGLLLIEPLQAYFIEIWIKTQQYSLKKMHFKISSAKCWPFCLGGDELTHWGRVTHICVSKLTIIGSDNGLSPDRRQAIIWTNAGLLLIGPLGTNFSEILIEVLTFSFKKMRFKVSSAKRRPFCLGLNVLTAWLYLSDNIPTSQVTGCHFYVPFIVGQDLYR